MGLFCPYWKVHELKVKNEFIWRDEARMLTRHLLRTSSKIGIGADWAVTTTCFSQRVWIHITASSSKCTYYIVAAQQHLLHMWTFCTCSKCTYAANAAVKLLGAPMYLGHLILQERDLSQYSPTFLATISFANQNGCRRILGFMYLFLWQLLTLMFYVPVTWIPSVLGLFPGAVTMRFKALTLIHFWNVRCICCAFLNHRFGTIKFLHSEKVTAWRRTRFKKLKKKTFLFKKKME